MARTGRSDVARYRGRAAAGQRRQHRHPLALPRLHRRVHDALPHDEPRGAGHDAGGRGLQGLTPGWWTCAPSPRSRSAAAVPLWHADSGHETDLFYDVVGNGQQRVGDTRAERSCGLEIDDELEFCRLLHWPIRRLCPFEDFVDELQP
jgi:hypothetical protein